MPKQSENFRKKKEINTNKRPLKVSGLYYSTQKKTSLMLHVPVLPPYAVQENQYLLE